MFDVRDRRKDNFFVFMARVLALPRLLVRAAAVQFDSQSPVLSSGKSRFLIWIDLVRWGVKFGEINEFYFLYGFEHLSWGEQDKYLSYRALRRHRDWGNGSCRSEGVGLDYKCLIRDKFVFGQFAASLGFSVPVVLGIVADKRVVVFSGGRQSIGFNDFLDVVPLLGTDIWLKSVLGACARSVWHVQDDGGRYSVNGAPTAYFEHIDSSVRYVVQVGLQQHPALAALYPHSVNTLRIVTIRSGDGIEVFSVLLRVGVNGAHSDNWATGGLVGRIDIDSRKTEGPFFKKPPSDRAFELHPDTSAVLAGIEIPYLSEAIEMVKSFHGFLYGLKSVGWDVAITWGGPVVIEANDDWEIALHQVVDGGLKTRFFDLHGDL